MSFPAICSPLQTAVVVDQYPHLRDLDLADEDTDEGCSDSIDILIGTDYYWQVVIGDIICGDTGPVALNSHFGWLVSGPTKSLSVNYAISTLNIKGDGNMEYSDNQLTQDLSKFWDTEAIGIFDSNQETTDQFPPGHIFDWESCRYQVTLPWKSDTRSLSDCHALCVGHLNQLYKRLRKGELILKEYDEIFRKQLEYGIIESPAQ